MVVKDYVPDGLSEFADALANPIKYQSDLDKRTHQLAVLIDGLELTEQEELKKSSLGRVTYFNYYLNSKQLIFISECQRTGQWQSRTTSFDTDRRISIIRRHY